MTTWSDAFSSRTDHLLELVLTETSTSSSGNTSVVTATLQINPPSDSASWNGYGDANYSLTFSGSTYTGSFSYDYRTDRSTQVLKTVSKTITHAANGTGTATASASADSGSGTLGTASISTKTLTLTDFTRLPSAPAAPALTRTVSTTIGITSAVASSAVTVSDYEFRYSTDGSTWSAAQAMGSDRIASLTVTATNPYYIQTRAYSSEGWGAWSPSAFIAGVPSAPASISFTREARNVTVSVGSSASSNGATITSYSVQYNDGSGWSSPTTATYGSVAYANLPAAKTYTFRAYATNSTGSSGYTESASVYIAAGGKRWTGSAFTATATAKRWDGTAWVDITSAKRWTGSAWTDLS